MVFILICCLFGECASCRNIHHSSLPMPLPVSLLSTLSSFHGQQLDVHSSQYILLLYYIYAYSQHTIGINYLLVEIIICKSCPGSLMGFCFIGFKYNGPRVQWALRESFWAFVKSQQAFNCIYYGALIIFASPFPHLFMFARLWKISVTT